MRERDIKKIFYLNEKENKRFKKNVLKSNLSGSNYLRSLITNYQPKDAHSDTILLPIIAELKSVGKTLNEIARTTNRFDFINTRYCNRVIERIDVLVKQLKVVSKIRITDPYRKKGQLVTISQNDWNKINLQL